MQMKTVLIVLSLTLLLLAGCAAKTTPAEPGKAVAEIDSSMSEIESLDKELDTTNLDTLDAELAELDQLDYG